MSVTPPSPADPIEAWEVLDLLTGLVEKSLVLYEEDEQGHGRYRLLETVRQYARDRLLEAGEMEGVRERHLDFFAGLAEQGLGEGSRRSRMERLEREHDNLRAALAWAAESGSTSDTGSTEIGLRLVGALWEFWLVRSYFEEGRQHLAGLLALPGAEAQTTARAEALFGAGYLAREQGDLGAAQTPFEESLAIYRELGGKQDIARSTSELGLVSYQQGDYGAASALYEAGLAIFRELDNKEGIADSLIGLARAARAQGHPGKARALLEEAHEVGEGTEARMREGHFLLEVHDYAAARSCYEEVLALRRAADDAAFVAWTLLEVGHAAWLQGESFVTQSHAVEALALFRELGIKEGLLAGLKSLGVAALALGRTEHAGRLLGAVEALREARGLHSVPWWWRPPRERMVEAVRAASLEQEFAVAWAEGRAMSLEEAIQYALEDAHA